MNLVVEVQASVFLFLVILLLLVSPSPTSLHNAVSLSLELKATHSLRTRFIRAGKWPSIVDKIRRNLAVGAQPFLDYFDGEPSKAIALIPLVLSFYYINMSIGVPPQYFNMALDTGSANFWVVGEGYNIASTSTYQKNCYNMNASRTACMDSRTFSLRYGTGWARGHYVTDLITIGGFTFQNQTFGVAESIPEVFGHQPVDGILGLAWPAVSTQPDICSPIGNMLSELDEPVFTIWLDKSRPSYDIGAQGVVTFGNKDHVNCDSNWNYVPLTSRSLWQFTIDEFRVGDFRTWRSRVGISDTGTALIGGPHGLVNIIISMTKANYSASHDLYTVRCDQRSNFTDLIFRMGNTDYVLPPATYIRDLGLGNGDCVLAVFGMYADGYSADWVLGDGFIDAYCNLYDLGKGRMGFARAKNTISESYVEPNIT